VRSHDKAIEWQVTRRASGAAKQIFFGWSMMKGGDTFMFKHSILFFEKYF
jgi:hypothetical protein